MVRDLVNACISPDTTAGINSHPSQLSPQKGCLPRPEAPSPPGRCVVPGHIPDNLKTSHHTMNKHWMNRLYGIAFLYGIARKRLENLDLLNVGVLRRGCCTKSDLFSYIVFILVGYGVYSRLCL